MSGEGTAYPDWLTSPVLPPNEETRARARARQNTLTKPLGSLGQLEELAIDLAGLLNSDAPQITHPHILLFAGDHGITQEGTSAYPSDVTAQMLANFVGGGAAISVLARELGADLHVVDVGTLSADPLPGVHIDKISRGTANFRREAALSPDELTHALQAGYDATSRSIDAGADFLIFGEMGIGNTSAASAITSALTGRDITHVVGAGTGLDQERIAQKVIVLSESLGFHNLAGSTNAPLPVLQKIGGHEIAALTGSFIRSAQASVPVLIDGFICSTAALAAVQINPSVRDWLIFSHRSSEPGHTVLLDALKAKPLLDLGLRLGEGSGAALALPLLRMACALHNDMATFDGAGVSTAS